MMRRREFIAGLGSAAAWPLVARAQQFDRVRRVGVLMGGSAAGLQLRMFTAFRRGLDELGWKPERNIGLEVRWGEGSAERIRQAAAELIAWSPDVIFVVNNLTLAAIRPLAGNVPIVFVGVGDPVGSGFVTSLARPGGNITGFESYVASMGAKWLEVLKETAPHITRAIAILHPETAANRDSWQSIQEAAPRLGVEVTVGGVHNAAEIETAFSSFATKPNGGVIVLPHAVTDGNTELMVELQLRYRLPVIHANGNEGALVSYGIDWDDVMGRAPGYVDRILRGAKPADLAVQAPTKFELIINLKTAKAIGVEVPPTMLSRADQVIE